MRIGESISAGTFRWAQEPGLGFVVGELYPVDLDGDGIDEVFFAGCETNPKTPATLTPSQVTLFGWKNGTFQNITSDWFGDVDRLSEGIGHVSFGDFDGNGLLDIFCSAMTDMAELEFPFETTVFYNQGGRFTRGSPGLSLGQHGSAVGDINRDGFVDVVPAFINGTPPFSDLVFLGGPQGLVGHVLQPAPGAGFGDQGNDGSGAAIADFLGDGGLSVVMTDSQNSANRLYRFVPSNQPAGVAMEYVSTLPTPRLETVAVQAALGLPANWNSHDVRAMPMDINEDGLQDLVLFSNGDRNGVVCSQIQFYLNQGAGAFEDVTDNYLLGYSAVSSVDYASVARDFNGDGTRDFFLAVPRHTEDAPPSSAFLLSDSNGVYTDVHREQLSSWIGVGARARAVQGPGGQDYLVREAFAFDGPSEVFIAPFSLVAEVVAPSIALSSDRAALVTGQTANITFALSAPSTDFTSADVSVSGGTLTNFNGSGTLYTAVFVPAAGSTADGVVAVASGVFTDAFGGANADGSDANNRVMLSVNTVVTINGTAGSDSLSGTTVADSIFARNGNDTVTAGAGNDSVGGGAGDDLIFLGDGDDYSGYLDDTGADTVYGGDGNDKLNFNSQTDAKFLDGGPGNDTMFGGAGNDTLDGGSGVNELYGNAGDDVYVIRSRDTYILDSSGTGDRAEVHADFVKLPSSIEAVSHLDGAQVLPYWIDCLLPDSAAGRALTTLLNGDNVLGYCFPTALPAYSTSARDAEGYSAFSAHQRSRTVELLDHIAATVDLRFVATTDPAAPNVLAFANNRQTATGGYAQYPDDGFRGSDVFISDRYLDFSDGRFGAHVLVHEVGHALGLKHPHNEAIDGEFDGSEGPYLSAVSAAEDHPRWTVMTYDNDDSSFYRLQFSPLDVAALHYLYGPSRTARTGDDLYAVSQTSPNFVWDGAGTDTLDASAATAAATLYLEPGYWGHIGAKAPNITAAGQVTVNFGSAIENLVGTRFGDVLHGTAAANHIRGGEGDDTLHGMGGGDSIDGGAGVDVVAYATSSDAVSISRLLEGGMGVAGATGTDILTGIEFIRFSDQTIAVSSLNVPPGGGVSIDGLALQGQTLSARHSLVDSDGLGAITYQWLADGLPIAGAVGPTIVLRQAQVGKAISVRAEYIDGFGTAESVTSTATVAVVNVNDAPTGAVTIAGAAIEGRLLTIANDLADADGLGVFVYRWSADGALIDGVTRPDLLLTRSLVGKVISVQVTYVDGAGALESVGSAATAAVLAAQGPRVQSVLDANSGLYRSTASVLAVAAPGLAEGDLLGMPIVLTAAGKPYLPKGSPITLIRSDGGFTVVSVAGGAFIEQNFSPSGVAIGKAIKLTSFDLVRRELVAGVDLNRNGLIGDVVSEAYESDGYPGDDSGLGIFRTSAGLYALDVIGLEVGDTLTSDAVFLVSGKKIFALRAGQGLFGLARKDSGNLEFLIQSGNKLTAQTVDPDSGSLVGKAVVLKPGSVEIERREHLYDIDLDRDGGIDLVGTLPIGWATV